jgi:hypothetical protein
MRTALDVLTQPVPSAPSLSSSVANSSPDVCASLLTTTPDGRTEGSSPLLTSASPLTAHPSARVEHWKSNHHRQKPKTLVCIHNLSSFFHQPLQTAPMSSLILSFLVSIARYMRKFRSYILSVHRSPLLFSVRSGAGGILISCQVLFASSPSAGPIHTL